MLERFLTFAIDIGFSVSRLRDDMIYLSNGRYEISIYCHEEDREKRWSLERSGEYVETRPRQINFALDDFEALEAEFKDAIRENKLKDILDA